EDYPCLNNAEFEEMINMAGDFLTIQEENMNNTNHTNKNNVVNELNKNEDINNTNAEQYIATNLDTNTRVLLQEYSKSELESEKSKNEPI
ncbi:10167_t:CDS:2, partial [Dentiscutata heterogama]